MYLGSKVQASFQHTKNILLKLLKIDFVGFYKNKKLTKNNFWRWISWLVHRWRTQRTAIRNVNCRFLWIIESLNANCGHIPYDHACLCVSNVHFKKFFFYFKLYGAIHMVLWITLFNSIEVLLRNKYPFKYSHVF